MQHFLLSNGAWPLQLQPLRSWGKQASAALVIVSTITASTIYPSAILSKGEASDAQIPRVGHFEVQSVQPHNVKESEGETCWFVNNQEKGSDKSIMTPRMTSSTRTLSYCVTSCPPYSIGARPLVFGYLALVDIMFSAQSNV
ncbi:hypothetical protein C8J56DRAFT_881507 [Mycena floridula]|nr:hypothetical protein C8J56DRAFT_881507 [Mycena floridula]